MVGNTASHFKVLAEYLRKTVGQLYKSDIAKASLSNFYFIPCSDGANMVFNANPSSQRAMTEEKDFIAMLARAEKSQLEKKHLLDSSYGNLNKPKELHHQKSLIVVIRTSPQDEFAAALQWWIEHCKKRIHIGSVYVKK